MTPRELKRSLARAGLSQAKAARLIGLTVRSMSRYIAGDVPIPRTVEYALRYVIEHGIEEEKE
jgi:predicted transcriptional regulator